MTVLNPQVYDKLPCEKYAGEEADQKNIDNLRVRFPVTPLTGKVYEKFTGQLKAVLSLK